MPFFSHLRWQKNPPDLEDGNSFGTAANIPPQYVEHSAQKAGTQRNMIFAKRVAELDCVVECRKISRNQFRSTSFVQTVSRESSAQTCFAIMFFVGGTAWCESAAVASGNIVDSIKPHHFFDQIHFTPQIATVAGNFPPRDF